MDGSQLAGARDSRIPGWPQDLEPLRAAYRARNRFKPFADALRNSRGSSDSGIVCHIKWCRGAASFLN